MPSEAMTTAQEQLRNEIFGSGWMHDQAKHAIRALFPESMLKLYGWVFGNIDEIPILGANSEDRPDDQVAVITKALSVACLPEESIVKQLKENGYLMRNSIIRSKIVALNKDPAHLLTGFSMPVKRQIYDIMQRALQYIEISKSDNEIEVLAVTNNGRSFYTLTDEGQDLKIGLGAFGVISELLGDDRLKDIPGKKLFWWIDNCVQPFAQQLGFKKILIERVRVQEKDLQAFGYEQQEGLLWFKTVSEAMTVQDINKHLNGKTITDDITGEIYTVEVEPRPKRLVEVTIRLTNQQTKVSYPNVFYFTVENGGVYNFKTTNKDNFLKERLRLGLAKNFNALLTRRFPLHSMMEKLITREETRETFHPSIKTQLSDEASNYFRQANGGVLYFKNGDGIFREVVETHPFGDQISLQDALAKTPTGVSLIQAGMGHLTLAYGKLPNGRYKYKGIQALSAIISGLKTAEYYMLAQKVSELETRLMLQANRPSDVQKAIRILKSKDRRVGIEPGSGNGNLALALSTKMNMIGIDSYDLKGPTAYFRTAEHWSKHELPGQNAGSHVVLIRSRVEDVFELIPNHSLDVIVIDHPGPGNIINNLIQWKIKGQLELKLKPGGKVILKTEHGIGQYEGMFRKVKLEFIDSGSSEFEGIDLREVSAYKYPGNVFVWTNKVENKPATGSASRAMIVFPVLTRGHEDFHSEMLDGAMSAIERYKRDEVLREIRAMHDPVLDATRLLKVAEFMLKSGKMYMIKNFWLEVFGRYTNKNNLVYRSIYPSVYHEGHINIQLWEIFRTSGRLNYLRYNFSVTELLQFFRDMMKKEGGLSLARDLFLEFRRQIPVIMRSELQREESNVDSLTNALAGLEAQGIQIKDLKDREGKEVYLPESIANILHNNNHGIWME